MLQSYCALTFTTDHLKHPLTINGENFQKRLSKSHKRIAIITTLALAILSFGILSPVFYLITGYFKYRTVNQVNPSKSIREEFVDWIKKDPKFTQLMETYKMEFLYARYLETVLCPDVVRTDSNDEDEIIIEDPNEDTDMKIYNELCALDEKIHMMRIIIEKKIKSFNKWSRTL